MDESQVAAPEAEILAPEVELPESAQVQAEAPEAETAEHPEGEEEKKQARTFTQEEVDAIAAKERAKAERKAARRAASEYERKLEELTRQPVQQAAKPSDDEPQLENFERVQDYVKAVAKWDREQAEKAQAQQEAARRQQEYLKVASNKAWEIFDTVEEEFGISRKEIEAMPISDAMSYAILDSDMPTKLLSHLHSNPMEIDRIAKLSPARQAVEIGKLEVKLSTPEKPKPSKAPAPVRTVGQRGSGATGRIEQLSQKDFEKWLYGA